jgi:hypothetical protein
MTNTQRETIRAARAADLDAALISEHFESTRLIAAVSARLDACDPETPTWDDVATMQYFNARMREMLGEVG